MYDTKKYCDVCNKEMKIKASSREEWEEGNNSPTKEWNLAYNISGIHICRECGLLIDNCFLRFKLDVLAQNV